jgi:hypothetical protein
VSFAANGARRSERHFFATIVALRNAAPGSELSEDPQWRRAAWLDLSARLSSLLRRLSPAQRRILFSARSTPDAHAVH